MMCEAIPSRGDEMDPARTLVQVQCAAEKRRSPALWARSRPLGEENRSIDLPADGVVAPGFEGVRPALGRAIGPAAGDGAALAAFVSRTGARPDGRPPRR